MPILQENLGGVFVQKDPEATVASSISDGNFLDQLLLLDGGKVVGKCELNNIGNLRFSMDTEETSAWPNVSMRLLIMALNVVGMDVAEKLVSG